MKYKRYMLTEDIVIPKGTVFEEEREVDMIRPYQAVLDNGCLKNSVMYVSLFDIGIKEMGDKFVLLEDK